MKLDDDDDEPNGAGGVAVEGKKKMHPNSLANLAPGWKKGQSGNPGGRAKGPDIMRRIAKLLNADDGKLADALATVIVREAMRGDPQFCKELLNRLEGRVPIHAELTGTDGDPIDIRASRDDVISRIAGQLARSGADTSPVEPN